MPTPLVRSPTRPFRQLHRRCLASCPYHALPASLGLASRCMDPTSILPSLGSLHPFSLSYFRRYLVDWLVVPYVTYPRITSLLYGNARLCTCTLVYAPARTHTTAFDVGFRLGLLLYITIIIYYYYIIILIIIDKIY